MKKDSLLSIVEEEKDEVPDMVASSMRIGEDTFKSSRKYR